MRTRRIVVAALAAVTLIALLVGVPALLLAGVGNPLPDWSTLRSGNLDDSTVLRLLACVVWIAWLQWLPGTLLEIAAARHRRNPAPAGTWISEPRHVSAGQGLSRMLVTAVMGVSIAGSLGTHSARAAAGPAPEPPPVVAAHLASNATTGPASTPPAQGWSPRPEELHSGKRQSGPIYVVGSDDSVGPSLWSIAQHTMGDPLRWREIWELNRGRSQPGGAVFTSPEDIQNGWRLRLPADATVPAPASSPSSAGSPGTVTVEPGENLTQIAQDDGSTEPAVWARNEGRMMSDGRVLTDPNLIKPGDTIIIPGPQHTPPTHAAPAPRRAPTKPAPDPSTPPRTDPGQARPTTPQDGPTSQPGGQPSSPTAPATPATAQRSEPNREHQPAASSSPSRRQSSDLPMVAFRDGGGLLLAGISLIALMGYARRQFRQRRPGRAISSCSPELLRVERTLLSIGGPAMVDVVWLDQTLRGLAHGVNAGESLASRLPDVVAARLSRDRLELILAAAQPDAPEPWVADETGTRWSIARDDESGYDCAQRAYHFAPFPTLTSVGYDEDGSQWLLDLERVGSLSLAGDRERCLNLARFLACELAHNTWSEMLQVTLVGFGSELAEINPDRLTYTDDFDAAIAELGEQVHNVEESLRQTGRGVLDARGTATGDVWAPHVVLIAPSAARDTDGLARLLAAMRAQRTRTAVALVLSDDPDHADATTWTLTVDEDGTLHVPAFGLDLRAQQVPAAEAAEFAQRLAAAAQPRDRPMPRPAGTNPWDKYADAAGALRIPAAAETALPSATDVPALHLADASPWMTNSVLPLPRETYLERAATTAEDLDELAPETNDEIREEVEATVGDLDADLAEWYSETTTRPRVSVLGPVTVRAQGPLPARNPRTQWHTEIVAYLATRPSGVSSEQYATDLWPNDSDPDLASKSKVRQSAMIVRKWLGKNPVTGVDYLPPAMAPGFASYRIEGCLLDAELFRRLRLRGLARGKDGIEDLWAALRLVTGEPFSKRRDEGYAWLAENPLHHIYAAAIVDVAHTVATHHLAAGEPEPAAAAAQVALDAGSKEDAPLLDQVAACDAQDKRLEANEFIHRILANHDAEVEEDLPPRTAEVLRRRQWLDPAS
jgi:nucleoid-associated protein YgaU